MKTARITICALVMFVLSVVDVVPTDLSSAERAVVQAHQALVQDLSDYRRYNTLAVALARRGEETGNADYYLLAQDALEESFGLNARNEQGKKIQDAILHQLKSMLSDQVPGKPDAPKDHRKISTDRRPATTEGVHTGP